MSVRERESAIERSCQPRRCKAAQPVFHSVKVVFLHRFALFRKNAAWAQKLFRLGPEQNSFDADQKIEIGLNFGC